MNAIYERIVHSLESEGYFAVPFIEDGEERVICAAKKVNNSLMGNTFWVGFRNGTWFLATWAPRYYHLCDEHDLICICIDFLRCGGTTQSQLPPDLICKYKAEEVSEAFFEAGE